MLLNQMAFLPQYGQPSFRFTEGLCWSLFHLGAFEYLPMEQINYRTHLYMALKLYFKAKKAIIMKQEMLFPLLHQTTPTTLL